MLAKLSSRLVGDDDDDNAAPSALDVPVGPHALLQRVGWSGAPSRDKDCVDAVCPQLTLKQRLYAFAICFAAGVVLSLTSVFSLTQMLAGNPAPFAIKYSLGNLISLFSTAFIVGPARQVKNMAHPTRWVTALVYLGAMAATLVFALRLHNALLVLLSMGVQFVAMLWYTLSYVPYGRAMASACLRSTCDVC